MKLCLCEPGRASPADDDLQGRLPGSSGFESRSEALGQTLCIICLPASVSTAVCLECNGHLMSRTSSSSTPPPRSGTALGLGAGVSESTGAVACSCTEARWSPSQVWLLGRGYLSLEGNKVVGVSPSTGTGEL